MNVPPADLERVATELGFAKREANYSVVGVGGVSVKIGTGKMVRDVNQGLRRTSGASCSEGSSCSFSLASSSSSSSWRWAGATARLQRHRRPLKDTSWDGKSTLVCATGDAMRVSNVTASIASGVAVKASGNCVLEPRGREPQCARRDRRLRECEGLARGGSVKGAHSIVAGGNASVDVQGVALIGPTKRTGNAKLVGVP